MNSRFFLISIFIFIASGYSFAQTGDAAQKKLSLHKQLQQQASEEIKTLHEGALLVRLTTRKKSIEALRKMGNENAANTIEKEQARKNKSIINAFLINFNFCSVYFFYSDYSDLVKERQFNKVTFLNKNLEKDSVKIFNGTKFLTAEFNEVLADTAKNYGGNNNGITALIIMSDQFIQLRRPFPFFVRTFEFLSLRRKDYKTVRILNRELHEFYNKQNN